MYRNWSISFENLWSIIRAVSFIYSHSCTFSGLCVPHLTSGHYKRHGKGNLIRICDNKHPITSKMLVFLYVTRQEGGSREGELGEKEHETSSPVGPTTKPLVSCAVGCPTSSSSDSGSGGTNSTSQLQQLFHCTNAPPTLAMPCNSKSCWVLSTLLQKGPFIHQQSSLLPAWTKWCGTRREKTWVCQGCKAWLLCTILTVLWADWLKGQKYTFSRAE